MDFKSEIELRKEYEKNKKTYRDIYKWDYKQFKKIKMENDERAKKNNEITNVLSNLINTMNNQNENFSSYTQILQDLIDHTLHGGNNHTKEYEIEQVKNSDGTTSYKFICYGAHKKIMEINTLVNEQNEIVSFNSIYLSTLDYEGMRRKTPSLYLNIENANADVSKVTTADLDDDYFYLKSLPNTTDIEWQNMVEKEVDSIKEKSL